MSEYNYYSKSNNLTFNQYLTKVFGIVALGLAITSIVAFVSSNFYIEMLIKLGSFAIVLVLGLCAAEIAIAVSLSSRITSLSKKNAWTLFIVYSVLTGISLSSLLLMYDIGTVWAAFAVTTIMFASMAIIGKTSNVDFTRFSSLLFPALIAIIVGTLLNGLLFRSSMINWLITYAGIIIFLVIIAMDIQKLRQFYMMGIGDLDMDEKLRIIGGFELYLDFINLFIRILQIMGRRRNNQ